MGDDEDVAGADAGSVVVGLLLLLLVLGVLQVGRRGWREPGEFLQRHDAGWVVVEEVDGLGAFGQVDGVGFGCGQVEAFEVAAGGCEGEGEGKGEGDWEEGGGSV